MTENKAIEIIKYASAFNSDNSPLTKALEVAIQALEEIQSYRVIGTVEEIKSMKDNGAFSGMELAQIASMQIKLKEYQTIGTIDEFKALKEKNTPKKVAYQGEHEKCPNCGSFHVFGKHCTECGQAVDYD